MTKGRVSIKQMFGLASKALRSVTKKKCFITLAAGWHPIRSSGELAPEWSFYPTTSSTRNPAGSSR